jgi:hypothetical protein
VTMKMDPQPTRQTDPGGLLFRSGQARPPVSKGLNRTLLFFHLESLVAQSGTVEGSVRRSAWHSYEGEEAY